MFGEVSVAKNNNMINKEGKNGNLSKAFIRAINPSKLSIIGCESVTFLSKSACNVLLFASFSAINFPFETFKESNCLVTKS